LRALPCSSERQCLQNVSMGCRNHRSITGRGEFLHFGEVQPKYRNLIVTRLRS
jgi:hypothetical protein